MLQVIQQWFSSDRVPESEKKYDTVINNTGSTVSTQTVAWILSRVGPTIRRGHTTVFVCTPRLLAIVVSLKKMQPL